MLRREVLVTTDVSEERIVSIIRVKRISKLERTLAVTSNRGNRSVLRLLVTANVVPSSPILATLMEVTRSSETSVLTRATRRNNQEDGILQRGTMLSFHVPINIFKKS
jgi:hypothetical protein